MDTGLKILLVEDEAVIAMLMEVELGRKGYQVTDQVATGEDAISSAKRTPSDLVLMDIRLAGKIDGIDAASVIKSELGIPIIFITGYDDQSLRERASALSPLAYLTKPLEIDTLEKVLINHFH